MGVLFNLLSCYNTVLSNDFFRDVYSEVIKNVLKVPKCSLNELAELCFVSPPTIRKMITQLGYTSYNTFRKDVEYELSHHMDLNRHIPHQLIEPGESLNQISVNISDLLKDISETIDGKYLGEIALEILSHKTVAIFAAMPTPQIQVLQLDLMTFHKEVAFYSSLHEQLGAAETLNDDTMAIFIKFDTSEVGNFCNMLAAAKSRGASVLLISNIEPFVERRFTDYTLSFDGRRNTIDRLGLDVIIAALSMEIRHAIIFG